jgi:CRP-like cAMP-binding protein
MPSHVKSAETDLISLLVQNNYLLRGFDQQWLADRLLNAPLATEKLYSNRPIYTAYRASEPLKVLYLILQGGPVITRSSPLDRIIAITYAGAPFGMRNLPLAYGVVGHAFPSLVEAYKTTDVVKLPLETVRELYNESETFRSRYDLLFELREKFQYHLLNCSTYPPQAVASLLRALIYQERGLGNQPTSDGTYCFDLPVEVIARTCQLNQRTVEQVLKGMQQAGLISLHRPDDPSEDIIHALDPEGLKAAYSATRDKVPWWPLK